MVPVADDDVVFERVDDDGEELPGVDEQMERTTNVNVNVDNTANGRGQGSAEAGVGFIVGLIAMYFVFSINTGVLVFPGFNWATNSPLWSTALIAAIIAVVGGFVEKGM